LSTVIKNAAATGGLSWHEDGNLSDAQIVTMARRQSTGADMSSLDCRKGYTLVDVAVLLLLIGIVLGTTAPISQRMIAKYQLNTAALVLSADLAEAKVRAIKANSVAKVLRESIRDYRVAGTPRQLPGMVQFDATSADSMSFNGLGAITAGTSQRFVLVNRFGDSREIRVYATGGLEVKRL
jgi:Tfp pilus assembly protein FimT